MKKHAKWTLLALGLAVSLASCTSVRQAPDEAWTRAPGERWTGTYSAIANKASEHWQYAWLAEAAYEDSKGVAPGACAAPQMVLNAAGWSKWTGFPNGDLGADLKRAHLRAEVWYNRQRNILAVSFGGTVFKSGRDWLSNLRWFVPGDRNDEYTALVRRFIPALRDRFLQLQARPEYEQLGSAALVSTGHSLGGGLAQQFAYALVLDEHLPRVSKVYAFDPSPVTGYYSVDDAVLEVNRKNLQIERIYERGEVLASLRSTLSIVYPLSSSAPAISEVRYNLTNGNPVSQHSIAALARGLARAAGMDMKGDMPAMAYETQCTAEATAQM
jgi:Lipase (class 3)